MERRRVALPVAVGNTVPVFIESAHGATVRDVDGNVLLDFSGGIGVLNVGHTNDQVVVAARRQMGLLTHSCFGIVPYEPLVALAEKLNAIVPGAAPKKTFFVNSGAEALENAVKIARRATGRQGVVVFENAFHGRTLLALTMTSKFVPYKEGFGPFAPEVYRLPYPNPYRQPGPLDAAACRRSFEEFFATVAGSSQIACVVIEPVVGEGGFLAAPPEWLQELAAICKEKGILLIADEVQTGFARTGKMFACEHSGLEPDLVTLAKSIAGGLPLSAVVGRAAVMDAVPLGGLGSTFGGNPVACAAGLAAIEFMEREKLWLRAAAIGEIVGPRFAAWRERFSFIGDARGLGAMRAIELVKDKATKEPDKPRVTRTINVAGERGLILAAAGTHGNIIRTLMPLVISDAELAEGLDVLEGALEVAAAR
jgi:4-aminobutyrate aminotransferase/(S)-3-amino-2-methylpropionate transaminase